MPSELAQFKVKLADIVNAQINIIESAINGDIDNENAISDEINVLKIQISEKKRLYEELGENPGIEEYGELSSGLKQKITRFFRDF